tara:strand:+ start:1316 stop:2227 length:912 start_codon:yes stop_codon:yes gene_type:complete
MKTVIKSFLVIVLFVSCSTNSLNLDFIEKQIDFGINQTEDYIFEETNYIKKAFATGIGNKHKDTYDKIFESSLKIKELSFSLFNSPSEIRKNIESIKKTYSYHNNLLIEFVNNDSTPDNDYLIESCISILGGTFDINSNNFNNYMDSLINTDSDYQNKIQLKQTYSQLKKVELKIWGYLNKRLKGKGMTMDNLHVLVNVKKTSPSDSIIGEIICNYHSSNAITTMYFGEIDSALFNGNSSKFYRAGFQPKIPIIGAYKTLNFKSNEQFKISNKDLVNRTIEGVFEIKHSEGTLFVPFKEKNVW